MKGTILIIEDEKDLAELVELYLGKEGLETVVCGSAEEGLEALRKNKFSLILLDINLPGMDGFEFLQNIRKEFEVPVIITSARESDEDIIFGLGSGADEFMVKPFSPKVLSAKVRALLRRVEYASETGTRIIKTADLEIHLDRYFLTKSGNRINMSAREFEVLAFLIENRERAFSPEEIYLAVWGNRYGDLSAVSVYIQRIRKKIENDPANPEIVETVHGKGYRFGGGI
ncbi:MAG: response regulator transcription factor [Spirochaetales bacterium]|nr:response regulator transcription factor [Spirochaetales bacterium]